MCDSGTFDCPTSTTQPVIMTTPSTPSPSPTSTQVPTQTPPPITTTTPTTPQQELDPTTTQEGTDPVQGPDQSTPITIEPSTTAPVSVRPPDTSGNTVNVAGLAGGLAVLGLAIVMAVTLTMVIALLAVRRKSHSNVDIHDNLEDLYENNAYNTKTEILAIAHVDLDTNSAYTTRETSSHMMGEYVEITDTDILKSMNATTRLPFPSCVHQQQDIQFTQNQLTSGNIPMKLNECYGTTTTSMDSDQLYATVEEEHSTTHTSQHGTTTTSMDSDLLYATVEEEHSITHTSQQPNEVEYDYIIT